MGSRMSEDEVRSFMTDGSRTAQLATVRSDGSPHVTPVWIGFDPDNGDLVFLTSETSVKARNIAHEPRVSVVADLDEMPFGFARVDGEVVSVTGHADDPDALLHWATQTARRFVGEDAAEEFGRRNAVPGEVVIRVRPTKLVGEQGVAD